MTGVPLLGLTIFHKIFRIFFRLVDQIAYTLVEIYRVKNQGIFRLTKNIILSHVERLSASNLLFFFGF